MIHIPYSNNSPTQIIKKNSERIKSNRFFLHKLFFYWEHNSLTQRVLCTYNCLYVLQPIKERDSQRSNQKKVISLPHTTQHRFEFYFIFIFLVTQNDNVTRCYFQNSSCRLLNTTNVNAKLNDLNVSGMKIKFLFMYELFKLFPIFVSLNWNWVFECTEHWANRWACKHCEWSAFFPIIIENWRF